MLAKTLSLWYNYLIDEKGVILTEKKNIFKNTTDCAALLALICAAFVVFVAHEGFKPKGDLKEFYQVTETAVYIGAAISFAISFLANIFSRKSPYVGLVFSLLPIWYLLNCFEKGTLTGKNPMFYVILAAVHTAGALTYTLWWTFSNAEGRDFSRSVTCAVTSFMITLTYFGLCILATTNAKYGEPLEYLRWGVVYTGIVCALAGLWQARRAEKGTKQTIAIITCAMGLALTLITMIVEFAF